MSTEINNLINSLSENNFKILVTEYVKRKYKTNEVRIVDGPYDGGNDLEIYIDDKDIKRNIQITVQKIGYVGKLEKDLAKARENVDKFNYIRSLDFYISQNISKDKRNELENAAEINFEINLRIYDGNFFAQEISGNIELTELVYRMHNINSNQQTKFDKSSKVVFDVLTHSTDNVEIKKKFISSFIYSYLFTTSNSTPEQIYNGINPLLNNTLDISYFEKELNSLRLKQFIVRDKTTNGHYLSEEKQTEISELYADVSNQETILIYDIQKFLKEKSIEIDLDELIAFLYKIYEENYSVDIEEITANNTSYTNSLRKSFEDLNNFFTKKGIDYAEANEISRSLLDICSQNDFLNKLSAVHLFTNLFNSDKLEKYINSKKQVIFIDTQILIRLLCVLSTKNYEFDDLALKSVRVLYDTLNKYKSKIEIVTSYDYIEEVANHLIDALKLIRFLELPFIKQLGVSKNVFYNAYIELKNNKIISENISLLEFMADLIDIDLTELESLHSHNLSNRIQKQITEIFDFLGFRLIRHEQYSNFQRIKRDYEIELALSSKYRSSHAIHNDIRTVIYLSTPDHHINGNGHIEEPYLVTWDTTFLSIRKKLLSDTSNGALFWYIYSPMKLVDRLSVMNFSLNPKSINFNIIALTESNFNYSARNSSFIDVISSFFNKENLSELGIIKKLAYLNSETRNSDDNISHTDFKDEEESPLIKVLFNIRNHYNSTSDVTFKDVITVFETKELENNVIDILNLGIKNNDFTKMFIEIDKLIKSESD